MTNEQFSVYAKSAKLLFSGGDKNWQTKPNHPVVNISWHAAVAYCNWLNQKYERELPAAGLIFCLPSEAEWEKATRGVDGRKYPWGNSFDPYRCNSYESGIKTTTPTDTYSPQGDSPFGAADMCGNVWEWTHSLYASYPYTLKDYRENLKTPGDRVVRGGSLRFDHELARVASRSCKDPSRKDPTSTNEDQGFRIAIAPQLS